MTGEPQTTSRSHFWVLLLAWFVSWAGLSHGYLENTDAIVTMHAARSWWATGDPGLSLEQKELTQAERVALAGSGQLMRGQNGKYYAQFAIGHQALMVPCVALGALFADLFPTLEARHQESHGESPHWGGHFFVRLFCSLLPIPFAALAALALFALARVLGCGAADAGRVMLITVLATQVGGGATETMSDVPGLCLLLWTLVHVARHDDFGGTRSAFMAGLCGGGTVLVRYPNAIPVAILGCLVLVAALRRKAVAEIAAFAAGAAPALLALLFANWWRFGSVLETGYGGGANASWWDMPLVYGLPLVLGAPGKGILWFSPPLWSAFLGGLPRRRGFAMTAIAAAVAPVFLVAHTRGWSGAQCWGIRYLTPSVAILVGVGLALGRPWVRWPRLVTATTVVGVLLNFFAWTAPYRGHLQLASESARVAYSEELAAGKTTLGSLSDQYFVDPHFSPLFGHAVYGAASALGILSPDRLPDVTRVMFAGQPVPATVPPLLREDTGFLHLLPSYLAAAMRAPAAAFWLPWLLLVAVAWRRALRALRAAS